MLFVVFFVLFLMNFVCLVLLFFCFLGGRLVWLVDFACFVSFGFLLFVW